MDHVTVIEPSSRWRSVDWREMIAYRDMLRFLVWRDIKARYAQTVVGLGWAVIRPVFSMIVFTVIFGEMANVSSDGAPKPIFYYAGLLPWTYFSTAMTQSTGSLVTNMNIVTKVYFPRLIIPLSPIVSCLVDFGIASTILGILMIVYGTVPTTGAAILPLLVLLMILTAFGIGMWLSAMAIQYRDVQHGIQFGSQLLMWAAPVVWPASLITENFPRWGDTIRLVYGLYPMAGVIEGFRATLLGTRPIPWDLIGMGSISAVVLCVTGAFYFRRMERIFADVA